MTPILWVAASQVMGDFQLAKVVPEIETACRHGKIAAGAIAPKRAAGGYTPSRCGYPH